MGDDVLMQFLFDRGNECLGDKKEVRIGVDVFLKVGDWNGSRCLEIHGVRGLVAVIHEDATTSDAWVAARLLPSSPLAVRLPPS